LVHAVQLAQREFEAQLAPRVHKVSAARLVHAVPRVFAVQLAQQELEV